MEKPKVPAVTMTNDLMIILRELYPHTAPAQALRELAFSAPAALNIAHEKDIDIASELQSLKRGGWRGK